MLTPRAAVIHSVARMNVDGAGGDDGCNEVSSYASDDTTLIGDGSKKFLLPCYACESTVLIKPDVLVQLIDGKFSTQFQIVDCRYPYEYDGGHIVGAINVSSFEMLLKTFPPRYHDDSSGRREILVFHCEFSSQRAPSILKQFRQEDRNRNMANYPRLDYPEIYLLDGGYKAFFDHCCLNNRFDLISSSLPFGDGYVTMRDEMYRDEERYWRQLRSAERRRKQQRCEQRSSISEMQMAIHDDSFERLSNSADRAANSGRRVFSIISKRLFYKDDSDDVESQHQFAVSPSKNQAASGG